MSVAVVGGLLWLKWWLVVGYGQIPHSEYFILGLSLGQSSQVRPKFKAQSIPKSSSPRPSLGPI